MATRTLTVKLVGDHKNLDRAFGAAGRSARNFGRIAGAAVAGVGLATAGLAVKSISDFAKFEGGMNEVFTLLPGISDAAMAEMSEQVKTLAADMGILPEKVVPALYQSLSAGVPQGNVFEFLETAQMLAVGGVTELETAVDGLSSVVNAYGSDIITPAEASDQMFTAVKLGKTTIDELAASLFNVTPTAAALGVGFENVTAGMAALTAQGVPTSVASTQMRQLFIELSKAGGKAATAFEDMSGQTFKDFISSGGDVAGALDVMLAAAEESGVGIADLFGSVEAGAAANALADNPAFVHALEEMEKSAGATLTAYEMMDQGVTRQLEKLQAKFSVVMLDIGERLAPAAIAGLDLLLAAMDAVGPYIDRVVDAFGEGGLGAALGEAARIFGELWPVVQAKLVELAGNLWAWIAEQAPIVGAQLLAWGQQFWAWVQPQIGPMLAQLAVLAAALYVWAVAQIPALFALLLKWGEEFVNWIEPQIPGMLAKLSELLVKLSEWIATEATPAILQALAEMGAAAATAAMTSLFQAGVNLVQGLIDGIMSMIGKLEDALGWVTDKLPDWKGPAAKDRKLLIPTGRMIMEGLDEGLMSGFDRIVAPGLAGTTAAIGAGQFTGRTAAPAMGGARGSTAIIVQLDSREVGRKIVQNWELDGGAQILVRAGR